jgi:hypothetical protein
MVPSFGAFPAVALESEAKVSLATAFGQMLRECEARINELAIATVPFTHCGIGWSNIDAAHGGVLRSTQVSAKTGFVRRGRLEECEASSQVRERLAFNRPCHENLSHFRTTWPRDPTRFSARRMSWHTRYGAKAMTGERYWSRNIAVRKWRSLRTKDI